MLQTEHRRCILIVEDDPALAEGLARALKTEDREIQSCGRLREARRILEGKQPEWIPNYGVASIKISPNCIARKLDPKTGYPAESDLASATVLCREGERADALSTVCFLYGKEGALALIESLPDTEALLITASGEVVCTSGLGAEGIPVTIR